jgi:hypothetical protein
MWNFYLQVHVVGVPQSLINAVAKESVKKVHDEETCDIHIQGLVDNELEHVRSIAALTSVSRVYHILV